MRQPIRIRLLGAAAGGGLPQWNCACANCTGARQGKIPSRTQSSIAINPGDGRWFLINASPDLRAQIESFPALHPGGDLARNSPIRDVLLTNADFDHVLGLFLLRERVGKLRIHCTTSVRETLHGSLRIDTLLGSFCGVEWCELPETLSPLHIDGAPSGLEYRAIYLRGQVPRYATETFSDQGQSVALEFFDKERNTRLLVAADVEIITPELRTAMETADAIFFDGTFWTDDELQRVDPTARTASQMGHIPIFGGSLDVLRGLRARHRIYTHINNTNPIFRPASPERAEVQAAGITVGEDGLEFEL